MRDYMNFMDRQTMSGLGTEKLLKLETERSEKTSRAVPGWVKYAGMAACLALFGGVCALAVLSGGASQPRPQPVAATAPPQEVYFNQVASVPLTDQAIAGDTGLHEWDAAQAAELFGSSPDDFPAFLEDLGLGAYDMEYYTVDTDAGSSNGDGGFRFLMKGNYLSYTPELFSSFYPSNDVRLEIYEGHSYLDEEGWRTAVVAYGDTSYARFTPCEINGRKVVAAGDKDSDWYAAAVFDLESGGKTYGVYCSATMYGDENARELVSKLVNRLTAGGIYVPEDAQVFTWTAAPALDYAELTQVYTFVDSNVVQKGDTDRPLTREELEAVCHAAAGTENYVWQGTAHFKEDGNLHAVVITGDKMDGTATVTVTIAQEEEVAFTRNLVEKDGTLTYFGAENRSKFSGFELVRCFWVDEWEHVRTQNAADTPNYYCHVQSKYCHVQSKPAGGALCVEVRGHVGSGTLQENQDFTTQWFYQIDRDGLWFQTGNVNGKDIWKLPVTDTETEPAADLAAVSHQIETLEGELADDLAGMYTMTVAADIETDEMDALFLPAVILREDGSCQCAQDPASSHLCEGHYSCRDGRVTVTCEQHHYEFEVVDSECLRFVAGDSDKWTRYIGLEVTDGAVFCKDGCTRHRSEPHHPEPTHHPEPSHHVEETHHAGGHH